MNMTQVHERLRLELLRRIQRGTLSVSLLARLTGLAPAHLSNFLHSRRQLSLEAMDRIFAAQHLTVADLLPAERKAADDPPSEAGSPVPLVSHSTALFEPLIRPSAVQSLFQLPAGALRSLRSRATPQRRAWQRFVAVRVQTLDALPMEPLLMDDGIVLIDRHYISLMPYRPNRPNLYAVRNGSHLALRYAELITGRLVLRPHNLAFPVDLIDVDPGGSLAEVIVGRVVLIVNEP
jgi:transcriptional regulator with XRE-family HTH domain